MTLSRRLPESTGAFVIGGGPAGLAAAIALRQRGLSVLVADGARMPIDKACGEGLLPDGVTVLHALGIQIPRNEAREFCGIRFLNGMKSADAWFGSSHNGLAVRRTVLHRAMVERAEQLGAELMWDTPVSGISHKAVHLGGRVVRAQWIIGADGSNSRVRRWVGLQSGPRPRLRFAFRQHFRVDAWTDCMEVYWGEHCQGYATAVSGEQMCIALASDDPHLRLADGLRTLPQLESRLKGAEMVSSERGALTGNRAFARVCRRNVVLIGDASGTVDAITGEGIGLGFRQAVVLAQCLGSGNLSQYQVEHRKLMRRPSWMARLMLLMDRRPTLQRRTIEVFQKHPEIFRRFLALHLGDVPPLHIVKDGLTLGWQLLIT